ncbi:ABC transporter transmembrane domain-containing protein [Dermabacter jinjuensis]|uniref:ABC transporter transmembrane domain-containing protein n=1 Tax=Dermabacter jinjuensis TaxID=1667168 RepID=UPI001D144CF0|nr:ABC transporter transmembrane domain-containing protein [Dermabacter jinjuensis]UEB89018.1 ABC transporter ATP-binding protein/permease [Dermabacter jinjuensis]
MSTINTPARTRKKRHASEAHLSRTELRERSVMRAMVRRNARPLTWFMTLAMLSEAIEMAIPVGIGLVIDHGIFKANLWLTVGGAVGLAALRLLANLCWASFFEPIMEIRAREQHNLRLAVTAAALDPASRQIDRPAGEILSIATSDADRAPDVFDTMTEAVPASIAVVGAGVWLTVMNPLVGLIVFASLALQVVILRVVTPILSEKYDNQQSRAADAASTATDLVHGLRVLQGLGVQTRARSTYRARSRIALDAALTNARFSGLSDGLMLFTSSIMIAAVVVASGTLTLEGAMSVGVFISIAGLVRNLSGMMAGLAGVPVWWASFSTSARRIRQLLSEMGRSITEPALNSLVKAGSPEALSARTEPTAPPRLPGLGEISTPLLGTVKDSQIVALVPESASDARLALTELSALDVPRASLLIEPHAVDLFDGTLREQLETRRPAPTCAGTTDDPDAWAHRALESAGADDLLRILPEGLDTRILDHGANLSGGQRQRLALARALAADVPVLVLNDPTTAVDAVTEHAIARGLRAARSVEDRITVLVAKAPALLAQADRVLFVQEGRVSAEGSHHGLMGIDAYREVVQR